MGRAKIAMEFISKEKARNTTYEKRKRSLIKKCHELSILCNVPICIIIYPYKEGKQPSQPEVYAFQKEAKNSTSNHLDTAQPINHEMAREIIGKYMTFPKEEKTKRELNLYDMFDERKRKANQELSKLRHKNALVKYPTSNDTFDGFNYDQLMDFLVHLDRKIEFVRQRMGVIKGNQEAAMIPVNNNAYQNLVDHHYNHVEYLNQFPLVNYPYFHQISHQVVPFDPNGFANHVCYDQGSGIVDNEAVGSSYGASFPVSMAPLESPTLFNVQLLSQCHEPFCK